MPADFRLLGEVEVRVGGRPLDLGHARQRHVLGALLVDAGRPVGVDQLVDRVWADRPPQRARETVYSYLSRLRRILDEPAGVRIVSRGGGYVLTVEPLAVDLHRFHHLVGRARTVADDEDALAQYDEALALWRGEALAGMDSPWPNGVRLALDAERLAVELDRNDLALDRGRHAEVAARLHRTASAHPLDERVAGQLMLALYRCGRRADALDTYRQIRLRLADELGADPDAPLQRLHRQILDADPSIAPPDRGRGSRFVLEPVPRQLPAPPRPWTGRDEQLRRLDAAARASGAARSRVVAITGMPGVGKSALAVHWGHRAAAMFPDGQFYVDLRGYGPSGTAATPDEAIRTILAAVAVPASGVPGDAAARANLYRTVLADRRVLIVLDNGRDADQVRALLPGSAAGMVLVTSRDRLTGLVAHDGAQVLELLPLAEAEAFELLAARLGPERIHAELGAATRIVRRCAGLPLALSVAAARAVTDPEATLAALARELGSPGGDLGPVAACGLGAAGGADMDLRLVFASSYRILRPVAARTFRLLGLHPGAEFSAGAAASLAGLTVDGVRPVLADLVRAHLVQQRGSDRFGLHDLLRAHARELTQALDPDPVRRAAALRLVDHLLRISYDAAMLIDPQREPIVLPPQPQPQPPSQPPQPGAVTPGQELPGRLVPEESAPDVSAWFDVELPTLLSAVRFASDCGFDGHCWRLAWTLADFLQRQGHWRQQLAVQETALAAARRSGDTAGQAHAHRALGLTHPQLGQPDRAEAHLQCALDLFTDAADQAGQALTHRGLSWVAEQTGDQVTALAHSEHALELYRHLGHRAGQARALNAVGWYHGLLGAHDLAAVHCEQALELHRELGDLFGAAATLDSLGVIHHRAGDHARAAACYAEAVDRSRAVGDRFYEAGALIGLGDAQDAIGDHAAARRAWQSAATILDQLGHPSAGTAHGRLAAR